MGAPTTPDPLGRHELILELQEDASVASIESGTGLRGGRVLYVYCDNAPKWLLAAPGARIAPTYDDADLEAWRIQKTATGESIPTSLAILITAMPACAQSAIEPHRAMLAWLRSQPSDRAAADADHIDHELQLATGPNNQPGLRNPLRSLRSQRSARRQPNPLRRAKLRLARSGFTSWTVLADNADMARAWVIAGVIVGVVAVIGTFEFVGSSSTHTIAASTPTQPGTTTTTTETNPVILNPAAARAASVSASPVGLPSNTTSCGGHLWVGPNTTCQFAKTVEQVYDQSGGPTNIAAFSPITDQSYTMRCSDEGQHIMCTGAGSNAVVYFSSGPTSATTNRSPP